MKRSVLLSMIGCAVFARFGTAQEAPPSKLQPADAVLRALPSSGTSVRELSDGRVIFVMPFVAGPKPGSLLRGFMAVADMKRGKVDSIPGFPEDNTIAFAADTSLVRSGGGWVFAKGTNVLGMLDATNPVVAAATVLIGPDSSGFVVATRHYGADSSDVVRVNRATAETELLVRIKRNRGVPAGVPAPMYNGVKEYAVYTLSGWLGIQRTAPYRVDWRSPEGKWTLGKPIPVPALRFDAREKLAYATEQARLQGGTPDRYLGKATEQWPDAVQPSYGGSPLATPDGKMIVYRTPTADYPNARYDVVNREGVAERQIMMGPNETIVGLGAKSVYVRIGVRMSEVQLERHPWP